jgi:hypothetical protein
MSYADLERAITDPTWMEWERAEAERRLAQRKAAEDMRRLEASICDWVENDADIHELEALVALADRQMEAREAQK